MFWINYKSTQNGIWKQIYKSIFFFMNTMKIWYYIIPWSDIMLSIINTITNILCYYPLEIKIERRYFLDSSTIFEQCNN